MRRLEEALMEAKSLVGKSSKVAWYNFSKKDRYSKIMEELEIVWKFDELEQMKENEVLFDSLAQEISSHLRPLWRYCLIFYIIFASLVNHIIFGDNY